jgi:hypothetical protein
LIDPKTILNFAWLSGALLLLTTSVLMYLRGVHRSFPWFFRYVLFVMGRAPILYLLRPDAHAYFYGYWVAEAVTVSLTFPVIYEVFHYAAGSSRLRISKSTFLPWA